MAAYLTKTEWLQECFLGLIKGGQWISFQVNNRSVVTSSLMLLRLIAGGPAAITQILTLWFKS